MPTSFWQAVEQRIGAPLSDKARRFLEVLGAERQWRTAPAANSERIIQQAARMVDSLHEAGYEMGEPIADPEPEPRPGTRDPRWSLWRDLRRAAGAPPGWEPSLARRVFDVSTDNPALLADRVELSFDHRLSQAAVVRSLENLWPRLTEAGWIRPTRTMENRAAELVRFVCLDNPPGTTWRDLQTRWNDKVLQEHPGWTHDSPRDFASRFHRHEEQLTGYPRGLEWFYDTDAKRLPSGPVDLQEMLSLPSSVQRYVMRRVRPVLQGALRNLGQAARETQALLHEGLTPEGFFGEEWLDIPADARDGLAASWTEGVTTASKLPDDSDIGDLKAE